MSQKNSSPQEKYNYNRFGSKGQRVGQAVVDILSKEQPNLSVEEVLEDCGLGRDYLDIIREEATKSKNKFYGKFYVLSLLNKALGEMGVANVLKHSCRSFKTKFSPKEVMEAHPNSVKTMYEVDEAAGEIKLLWTLPAYQDCISIIKNPKVYDAELVNCVMSYFNSSTMLTNSAV